VPRRTWPLFIVAALPAHFAVQLDSEVPLPMVACWYVSNVFEAIVGAAVVRHFTETPFHFESFRHFGIFCGGAVLFAPFVSSFVDAAFVQLNAWGEPGYWQNWQMRFFSNVIAVLTVTAAIVSWHEAISDSFWRRPSVARTVEALILVSCLIAVCVTAFNVAEAREASTPVLVYASFPLLLWATVRFGPAGTSASILLVAFLAIWSASHGAGPFGYNIDAANAKVVQLFLFVVALPLMAIAIILRDTRRSAEAARSNEDRLTLALDAAQMQMWDWDRDTDRMSWSVAKPGNHKRIEASTIAEFMGLVHPGDRSALPDAIDAAARSGSSFEAEFRLTHPGSTVTSWLMMKGKVHSDTAGNPSRMIGIALDTTEHRRIELQSRELRDELSHMNRVAVLGELTGALAHELNQPLTAVLSNAEAGRFIVDTDTPDLSIVREILRDIVTQSRRAADVIRSLRTLLQKEKVELQALNLNQLVRETMNLEKSTFIARKVVPILELSAEIPAVKADRVQLQQVLLNLIMNACQAMAEQGVERRRLVLRTTGEGGVARVYIQDTGPGIPEEKLERVFEPFFTTKPEGLGLGLSICRSIAVAHSGSLRAANHADGGAIFELTLPVS
jgi:signal transduction histidine kinase